MSTSVSMKAIAAKAGVSVMTVSRALNNSPLVRLNLREKIRKLANRMGYRPNPMVTALMTGHRMANAKTSTLAVVTSKRSSRIFPGEILPATRLKGIIEEAGRLGFKVDYFHGSAFKDSEHLNGILKSRGIRGVIFESTSNLQHDVILDWDRFVCIKALSFYPHAPLHQIRINRINTINLQINTLRNYGYERIGLIISQGTDISNDRVITGLFNNYQSSLPVNQRIPVVYPEHAVPPSCQKDDLLIWYEKYRPDVIISDINLKNAPRDYGLNVPDHIPWSHFGLRDPDGSIAGTHTDYTKWGSAAVRFLAEQLYANNYGLPPVPYTVTVDCSTWVDGRSVPRNKVLPGL